MQDLSIFSESYSDARQKFIAAATESGGTVVSYRHPHEAGPAGEPLYLDVARLGPANAARVLVVGCGTHGIEGYSGSASQTHWLRKNASLHLDAGDTSVLFFHAHNPWGFAHALRFTEENVDLNRNFIDFTSGAPSNAPYELVHAIIAQEQWNDDAVERMFVDLDILREKLGEQAFSDAFNGGQYTHPDGVFYGGTREQWSNIAFRRAVQELVGSPQHAAIIDFHTGIGPERGHVFLCFHQPGSAAYERARIFWGNRAVNREGVTHKAVANYQGLLVDAFVNMLPETQSTAVVVEFGTLPRTKMQRASMAARWLWASNTTDQALRARLMNEVRQAFYPSAPDWRAGVLAQSSEIIDSALNGLRSIDR